MGEITGVLRAWNRGDREALAQLIPLVYPELYGAARRCMAREKPGTLFQTTALVNELYLSLARLRAVGWQDRRHFFAFCAQAMRHILVDMARSQGYLKRGGALQRVPMTDSVPAMADHDVDLLALDAALKGLAALDERKSRVVELRYFGGLSLKETAEVLEVSEDTVGRDWAFAKGWLFAELRAADDHTG